MRDDEQHVSYSSGRSSLISDNSVNLRDTINATGVACLGWTSWEADRSAPHPPAARRPRRGWSPAPPETTRLLGESAGHQKDIPPLSIAPASRRMLRPVM